MSLRSCPIQEICQMYKSGSRKPPNHDVRDKMPCKLFLDVSCDLSIRIQLDAMGLTSSCLIARPKKPK